MRIAYQLDCAQRELFSARQETHGQAVAAASSSSGAARLAFDLDAALRELTAAKAALDTAAARAVGAQRDHASALAAERARSDAAVDAAKRELSDVVKSLWADVARATAERDAALAAATAPGTPGASPINARLRGDANALATCSVEELKALSVSNNTAGAAIRDALMHALVTAQVQMAAAGAAGPGASGNGLCPVCEDEARPRDTRLAPCGHVFCGVCAGSVRDCPMCRAPVQRREHVFL